MSRQNNSKNQYQITFDEKALIGQSPDDGSIGMPKFNFVKID